MYLQVFFLFPNSINRNINSAFYEHVLNLFNKIFKSCFFNILLLNKRHKRGGGIFVLLIDVSYICASCSTKRRSRSSIYKHKISKKKKTTLALNCSESYNSIISLIQNVLFIEFIIHIISYRLGIPVTWV